VARALPEVEQCWLVVLAGAARLQHPGQVGAVAPGWAGRAAVRAALTDGVDPQDAHARASL
jgi:hypothetical protein